MYWKLVIAAFFIVVPFKVESVTYKVADREVKVDPLGMGRPFTVIDSATWARLEDLSENPYSFDPVLHSPNSRYFVVRVTRGVLEQNAVRDRLLLYSSSEVERFLSGSDDAPVPTILVDILVSNYEDQIRNVTWIEENQLAFSAKPKGSASAQVFVVDVRTGITRRITNHPTGVLSFAIQPGALVYFARAKSSNSIQRIADDGYLTHVINPQESRSADWATMDLFAMALDGTAPRRIEAPTVAMNLPAFGRIWLSPSGRYAVTFTPAVNAPYHWSEYEVPYPELLRYTPDRRSSDPKSYDLQSRTRLQLVDVRRGIVRPLLDAPSGFLSGNLSPYEVFWLPGEEAVVVTNTYLPLRSVAAAEREARRRGPAIAEINIESGHVEVIAWEPRRTAEVDAGTRELERIVSFKWHPNQRKLTVGTVKADGRMVYDSYVRSSQRWQHRRLSNEIEKTVFKVVQDMSSRPVLTVYSTTCKCRRVLLDPNAHADGLRMRQGNVLKWRDRAELEWKGGLFLPHDFRTGSSYPLIVQTHGFNEAEYLIAGPNGTRTAFSAQALAAKGFVVLQVEDNRRVPKGRSEGIRYAEGYRAAVARLVSDGLVDSSRVGIVLFSRSGLGGMAALADHPSLFRAAVFSDAIMGGYIGQMSLSSNARDVTAAMAMIFGDLPTSTASGIAEWMHASPMYRLSQIEAAVRIEALSPSSVLDMWEAYALLRRSGLPADFIYIPHAVHALFNSKRIYISQQGTLDWFRFWLLGEEDPDPSKNYQYRRWRQLSQTSVTSNM